MKIIVFSDLHGNQYALQAALPLMEKEKADRRFFLGDVFGYYYGQAECLKILRQMKSLTCLKGNHEELYFRLLEKKENPLNLVDLYGSGYLHVDEIPSEYRLFIESWKNYCEETIDNCKLGFFHGTPQDPLHGRLYPDTEIVSDIYNKYDFVFLGHTHHKMYRKYKDTTIYNPGSLGQQRDGQGCSYIVFDTVTKETKWRVITYDLNPLLREIEDSDSGTEKLIEPLLRCRGRWTIK